MSDVRGGPPPSSDPQEQLRAKLQGLERMRVAGLLREQDYRQTKARLEEQLDALRAAGGTAAAPAPMSYAPAPPLAPAPAPMSHAPAPPLAPAPAPMSLAPRPAPAAQPAPAAAPRAAAPVSPSPAPGAWVPPPPPPPEWGSPQRPARDPARSLALVVGGVLIVFVLATLGMVVIHPNRPQAASAPPPSATSPATPSPTLTATPTPDADATLAALRNAQPAPGQPLVTPAQAQQLVTAFWPVREQGLSHRNPDTIHAIEDGAAGEWDAIGCTFGCPPPAPRPLQKQQVMVPMQTSYPASFMAQVLTTQYHSSDALVEIMVFTRKSASVPWFLSFDTGYSGLSALHEFPSGPGVYDAPAPHNPSVDTATLPGQLAAYWQYWRDNGVAPPATHFAPGAFTSDQGLDIYKTWVDDRASGITDHTAYTAGTAQDGMWSFAVTAEYGNGQIDENAVLTCGTVRYRDVGTPAAPVRSIVQDTSFEPYGSLLRPGEYSSVTLTGLHMSCMLTTAGSPLIVVEGLSGEQTRIVGVPFSGSGVSA